MENYVFKKLSLIILEMVLWYSFKGI